jgi:hypothetical protein
MGLIKFLLIAVIILWIIRILVRLIFPVMLKSVFGNMQQQAANGGQQQRSSKPEGSISIDYMPKKDKKGNADKLGDFVDYEEIK